MDKDREMMNEERDKDYSRPHRGGFGGRMRKGQMPFFKKKVCKFCTGHYGQVTYKDYDILRRYVSERGKILPRRMTGTCAKHQNRLAIAIKRARVLALLPFVSK